MSTAPARLRRSFDPSPDAHRRLRPAPTRRPKLEVVPEPQPTARLGRRMLIAAGVLALLMAPFALVLVHVELTAGQLRLTSLQAKGDAAQSQFDKLRLQVAELESPARVVDNAKSLGMVTPTTITYLTPSPVSVPNGVAPASAAATPGGPGVGGWSAAKRVDTGR